MERYQIVTKLKGLLFDQVIGKNDESDDGEGWIKRRERIII